MSLINVPVTLLYYSTLCKEKFFLAEEAVWTCDKKSRNVVKVCIFQTVQSIEQFTGKYDSDYMFWNAFGFWDIDGIEALLIFLQMCQSPACHSSFY